MNIDDIIKECEILLKQIKQYDPDPFYVNYFFSQYLDSINNIITGIFEEADRDFGLFLSGKITETKFYDKAKLKNDENAIRFSEWFRIKHIEEHKNLYPNFMNDMIDFKNNFGKLPEIKIMIRASNRYKDDINQEITVKLNQKKLCSRDELNIEVKRQLPIFLEIINYKRQANNEPRVEENQVRTSAFLDVENYNAMEIVYAVEIYIPVIKRLVEESRKKIMELSRKI